MRKILALLLLLSLLLSLAACAAPPPTRTADELLTDLLHAYGEAPAGNRYASTAKLEDAAYFSEDLFLSLYADANGKCEGREGIEQCAVYLGGSDRTVFEVAVFRCYGTADTPTVAQLSTRRAALVRSLHLLEEEEVTVQIFDHYVILFLCREPARAAHAIHRATN